jgi:hypothetical protein
LVFSVDLVRAVAKGAGFEAIHGKNRTLLSSNPKNIVYLVCTPRALGPAHAQESDNKRLSSPCTSPGCSLAGAGDLGRAV